MIDTLASDLREQKEQNLHEQFEFYRTPELLKQLLKLYPQSERRWLLWTHPFIGEVCGKSGDTQLRMRLEGLYLEFAKTSIQTAVLPHSTFYNSIFEGAKELENSDFITDFLNNPHPLRSDDGFEMSIFELSCVYKKEDWFGLGLMTHMKMSPHPDRIEPHVDVFSDLYQQNKDPSLDLDITHLARGVHLFESLPSVRRFNYEALQLFDTWLSKDPVLAEVGRVWVEWKNLCFVGSPVNVWSNFPHLQSAIDRRVIDKEVGPNLLTAKPKKM